jgi:hypothetical protein
LVFLCNYQLGLSLNKTSQNVYDSSAADSLFESGQFLSAATSYEALVYQSIEPKQKNLYLMKRAICFELLNDFLESDKALNRLTLEVENDSFAVEVYLKRALASYNLNQFKQADFMMSKMRILNTSKDQQLSAYLLQSLIDIQLEQFFMAYAHLKSYFLEVEGIAPYDRILAIKAIDTLFSQSHLPQMKSLKKARRLSFFLPGGGLYYLGEPKKALANGALQAAALSYTIYNVLQLNLITATFAGGKFFLQTYFGSVNQLNEIVMDKNAESKRKFNFAIKNVILKYAK